MTEQDTADIHPEPSLALVKSSPFSQLRELATYLADLDAIAKVMCQATILPREMQAPANLKLVLMQGLEMGFTPIQAIRASFIISAKNEAPKVGYYVAGLVALVRSSGVCRFFRVEETTAEKCRVVCARKDEEEGVLHTFELTMQQARAANLDKKWERDETGKPQPKTKYPWITAPADMLLARCSGRAVKAVFQDVVFGLATPEELDDLESAETLERTRGISGIPAHRKGAVTYDDPEQATDRPSRKPDDVVDAEIVDDRANPAPAQPDRTPGDEGSGDPGWDDVLKLIATFANLDTIGWLPDDLIAEWSKRVDGAKSKPDLNALAPWIGEMSKRAAGSKACSEVAAKMKVAFNAANASFSKKSTPTESTP